MKIESFLKKSNQIEEKKFNMEAFIDGLQAKIKANDNSTNFEYLGKKYAYLVGDLVRAEKTNVVNGTEYTSLQFAAIDALNENKQLPLQEGNFTYIKDEENPNGHMWISKLVGTSHSENIKEEGLEDQSLGNIKKISEVITADINTVDDENFLYRKQ